jgi:hypothetical protein
MTSVLFYPICHAFPSIFITALIIGETGTSVLAAVVAAVQVDGLPVGELRFSVAVFFLVIAAVCVVSLVCALLIFAAEKHYAASPNRRSISMSGSGSSSSSSSSSSRSSRSRSSTNNTGQRRSIINRVSRWEGNMARSDDDGGGGGHDDYDHHSGGVRNLGGGNRGGEEWQAGSSADGTTDAGYSHGEEEEEKEKEEEEDGGRSGFVARAAQSQRLSQPLPHLPPAYSRAVPASSFSSSAHEPVSVNVVDALVSQSSASSMSSLALTSVNSLVQYNSEGAASTESSRREGGGGGGGGGGDRSRSPVAGGGGRSSKGFGCCSSSCCCGAGGGGAAVPLLWSVLAAQALVSFVENGILASILPNTLLPYAGACGCACVCICACACVRACARACVRITVCVRVCRFVVLLAACVTLLAS